MEQYMQKLAGAAAVLFVGITLFAAPIAAGAQSNTAREICQGVNIGANAERCGTGGADRRIEGIIDRVINLFTVIVGIAAVLMIIVAGVKYVTSAGDPNNVNSAKNTLLYAIIGLVIVALAQFIVRFVLSRATT